jgi:hypothetical protein
MAWITIIQIIWQIIQLIFKLQPVEQGALLARLKVASKKAKQGDPSELQKLRDELVGSSPKR